MHYFVHVYTLEQRRIWILIIHVKFLTKLKIGDEFYYAYMLIVAW